MEAVHGMMSDQQTESPAFQYSVKIERTAKGARWIVHCYSNDKETALKESIQLYKQVGERLDEEGQGVAPVERSGKE